MINSGRLSRPTVYAQSSLNTPDAELFEGAMTPGTNCVDAPVNTGEWLLNHLGGRFVALTFDADPGVSTLDVDGVGVEVLVVAKDLSDPKGTLAARYDMRPGTTYLIRPDQHVAARWRTSTATTSPPPSIGPPPAPPRDRQGGTDHGAEHHAQHRRHR